MKHLPIFMNLHERECLVVGAGDVASRKAELLLRAHARVTVVAPNHGPAMAKLIEQGRVIHLPVEFKPVHIQNKTMVIAATDNNTANRWVYEQCSKQGIPVNVADEPDLCSFILPAIVDRDPITIAISTGGSSPVLARFLKSRIETLIPASFAQLGKLLAKFRHKAKATFTTIRERRLFWEDVLNGPIGEIAIGGRLNEAEHLLNERFKEPHSIQPGEVFLIGAGPGDPDLMTFKALRLLQKADVVVYDRLVSQNILDLARKEAEFIYVGKKADFHSVPQEGINELLAKLALDGKCVARLKGGDPFIFGRGGEEIEVLAEHHIPFQIVPGITAASGCAAYSGIPLTHRDYSQSVRFITGHQKKGELDMDWHNLVHSNETLVFYMGLKSLPLITQSLQQHGMPETMNIALIEKGTTEKQRVITGTLANIEDRALQATLSTPTLIIVGEVVKLHQQYNWFMPETEEGCDVFEHSNVTKELNMSINEHVA